jgi:peptidoglycan/xylan/chitin deacetylase (PgdA/CDA1 family)
MHNFLQYFVVGGLVAAGRVAAILFIAGPVAAAECPGHPDAIGTSRTIVVAPGAYSRLGTIQYPDTLPLVDKEVVITFDDGPLPPSSNRILDTLAAQCVKATFFLVGEIARSFPTVVRRIHEEGHTIGTHSEDHPLHFDRLSADELHWEIEEGIADVAAAVGNTQDLAPFFRIPGFGRSEEVETNSLNGRWSFSVPTSLPMTGTVTSSRARSFRARSAGSKSAAKVFSFCTTFTRPPRLRYPVSSLN